MVSLRLGQDTALTVDLPVIHSRVPRFATRPCSKCYEFAESQCENETFSAG